MDPLGGFQHPRPPAAIGDDLHRDFVTILTMCIDPCIGGREGGPTNIIHCKGGLNKKHSF